MILHTALFVRSMNVALDFYCAKLGFSVSDDLILESTVTKRLFSGACSALRLVLLKVSRSGAMLELVEFDRGDSISRNGLLKSYRSWVTILVVSLQEHIDRLAKVGIVPVTESVSVSIGKSGPCKFACYEDPDGNMLEFLEVMSPSRSIAKEAGDRTS
jgi:catechol 2,3-dioxygenase-like lactoylglutathione lyase family enzyme